MRFLILTMLILSAFPGSAVAKDAYRGENAYRYEDQNQQVWDGAFGSDDRAEPKKIFNWPDQRYYGQHGMMLD